MVGCAVPIVSPAGDLIACLGVSVPAARVGFAGLDAFIGPLQGAAALLSETILQDNEEVIEFSIFGIKTLVFSIPNLDLGRA